MDPLVSDQIYGWCELFLLWVGYGTCVGLLAKAVVPGRDPGGAIATLLMGITGVIIGCGVFTLAFKQQVSPITSLGLLCGTLGAALLLVFYRLLGGYLIDEAGSYGLPSRRRTPVRRRRRRRRYSQYLED